ncbi:MAG: hypothetical protein R2701_04340 [Acidimicrobiales bacterium]
MDVRPKAVAIAALAIAATSVLVGCGADGGSDAKASDGATTTTVEVTTTTAADDSATTTADDDATTTTAAEDGSESDEGRDTETSTLDTLPDGVHYGYMAGLESGKVEGQAVQVIIWDEVEFFTGTEAVAAAKEDGAIPAEQDFIENDYYIRNQNQTVRRLAVVPEAQVYTLAGDGGSTDTIPASVDEVWNQPYLFKIDVGNVRGITTISSIEAVFLP